MNKNGSNRASEKREQRWWEWRNLCWQHLKATRVLMIMLQATMIFDFNLGVFVVVYHFRMVLGKSYAKIVSFIVSGWFIWNPFNWSVTDFVHARTYCKLLHIISYDVLHYTRMNMSNLMNLIWSNMLCSHITRAERGFAWIIRMYSQFLTFSKCLPT